MYILYISIHIQCIFLFLGHVLRFDFSLLHTHCRDFAKAIGKKINYKLWVYFIGTPNKIVDFICHIIKKKKHRQMNLQ